MNAISEALVGYLEYRQRYGLSHCSHLPWILGRFARYADSVGAQRIASRLFLDWRHCYPETKDTTWSSRLCHVRGFAKWCRLGDPAVEVPPSDLIRVRARRPKPYIYSRQEISAMLDEAGRLPSPGGLRAATCQTLFGLLAVTGLRLGEALALDDGDVDLDEGVLTIGQSKNGSWRFVPVARSTCERLAACRQRRRRLFGTGGGAFFLNEKGKRPVHNSVQADFARIGKRIGLRDADGDTRNGHGPRIHDLRHSYSVSTMIRWYREGLDVNREITRLTTVLGHRTPASTYWHVEAVPELMELACRRAEANMEEGR